MEIASLIFSVAGFIASVISIVITLHINKHVKKLSARVKDETLILEEI